MHLTQNTDLFDGGPKRMVHFAPSPILRLRLGEVPALDYLTADLHDRSVTVRTDITNLCFPDGSFDVICCSHVLEHVPDDRRAMRELRRVLAPNGWAVLIVPITAERTFEDPSITDPEEREKLFGQSDHVRRYGPDFTDRLTDEGFRVTAISPADLLSPIDREFMGAHGDLLFRCTR